MPTVLLDRQGPVLTLTLNRPEVLNALNEEMGAELAAALPALRDPEIRCVVLAGAGRGFMAGGDVRMLQARAAKGEAEVRRAIQTLHEFITGMCELDKPVVAALMGPVAGAGVSIAGLADLAIAAEDTVFTFAYTMIGTSPDGGASFGLPRQIGLRRAMEMALLSRPVDAATALQWGLVNQVVPNDQLADAVTKLAGRLSMGPTLALGGARKLMRASLGRDLNAQLAAEEDGFAACSQTEDFAEGVAAFIEKRPARFKGA